MGPAVGAIPVKVYAVCSGVAEYAVKDYPYALFLGFSGQIDEIRFCSEGSVDLHVVTGVIAVVRCGFEDRVQIDRCNAERSQIIQLFTYTVKAAAVDRPAGDFARLVALIVRRSAPVVLNDALCVFPALIYELYGFLASLAPRVVSREAVREYLIDDAVLIPFRHLCFLIYSYLVWFQFLL